MTIYENADACDPNGQTYRIITGPNNNCYTLNQGMPGTHCAQYNNGGADGHSGCVSGDLNPQSLMFKNQNGCFFFPEADCKGTIFASIYGDCFNTRRMGQFKSFKCFVSLPFLFVCLTGARREQLAY